MCYCTLENGTPTVKRIDGVMTNLSIEAICGSLLLVNETFNRLDHTLSGLVDVAGSNNIFFFNPEIRCLQITASVGEIAMLEIEID